MNEKLLFSVQRRIRQQCVILGLKTGYFTAYGIIALAPAIFIFIFNSLIMIVIEILWIVCSYYLVGMIQKKSQRQMSKILPVKLINR